jgi:septal ring factor EnvC (AmiA/AmiB activator)
MCHRLTFLFFLPHERHASPGSSLQLSPIFEHAAAAVLVGLQDSTLSVSQQLEAKCSTSLRALTVMHRRAKQQNEALTQQLAAKDKELKSRNAELKSVEERLRVRTCRLTAVQQQLQWKEEQLEAQQQELQELQELRRMRDAVMAVAQHVQQQGHWLPG